MFFYFFLALLIDDGMSDEMEEEQPRSDRHVDDGKQCSAYAKSTAERKEERKEGSS